MTGCAVPDNLQRLNPAELSLKKLLGRGGFATVYAATYASEPVAAKVLQPAECNIDEARMLEYERMFLREAACTASQEHRSIIQCLGLLQLPAAAVNSSALGGKLDQPPMWCMVLELCEPYTTKTLITQGMTDNRRTYTNLQAYTWLTQLASALAHLHSHRPPIIHRDIKQENLLLKKVTRPPPAAAAAAAGAGGGVPAGAQRLPGGGGGTQLEAKLADLGLHVVVEAERSVMLRRRASSLGTRSIHSRLSRRNSTARPERSAHGGGGGGSGGAGGGTPLLSPHPRLSKCGSSAAAFGGTAAGDDDDTPFLAVSSVAPSGQASSRPPSWSLLATGGGGVPMSRPLLPSGHSGNRRRRPASAQAVVLGLHTGAAGEAGCGVAGVATAANATAEDISLYGGCLGGARATAIPAQGDADSAAAVESAAERSPFVATSQQALLGGDVRDEVAGGTAAVWGTMQEASTCRSSDRGTFEFDVTATATGSSRPPPQQQQQQQQQATLAAAARGGGPQQMQRAADGQGGTSSRTAAASAADVGTSSWATRPASSSAPPPGSSRGGMPRSLLSIITGVDRNDASGVVGITSAGGASGGGSRHVAASPAAQPVASTDALAVGEAWRPYQRHSPGAGDGRAVHTHQLCAAASGSPATQRWPPWPLSPAAAAADGGGGVTRPPALSLPSPTAAAAAGVPRGGLVAPSMSVCLTEELIDLAEVEGEGDDVEGDEAQAEPAAGQQERPAAVAVGSGAGRAADAVGTAAAAALQSKLIPRPKSAAAAATSSPDRRLPWAGTAVAVCGGSEAGVGGGAMHVRGVGQACVSCVGGSSAAGVRAQHCPGAAAAHADVSDRPPSGRTESISRLLARHPDLMVQPVGPDGSFTSGLRRVHSVLSQFRQSELKQLRQSSLEWVFGLTGRAGSCMYMAPEVFRKLPYNEKADVFSFGVVMYELLSRELLVISYFNTSRGAKLGMHQPEDYAEMVCDGYRPPRPKCLDHTDQAWALIEACWQDDPVQRPDMDTVLVRLRELQREEELHPTDPPPGGLAGCGCVIC